MKNKAAAAPLDQAPLFYKQELIAAGPRLFNAPPEVVAGALYDVPEDVEAITIEAAREKVHDFLTRPVQNEGGK